MSQSAIHLKTILADTFVLYMKSFHIHWNMREERFYFLHRMIEEQYGELANFIDLIAERIRQKDEYAPKSLQEMVSLKTLHEAEKIESASNMLIDLMKSYEHLLSTIQAMIEQSGSQNDFVTQDILIEFARFIEKTVWILKSHQK